MRVKCSKTEQAEHFDSGLHFLAMWWLVWWEGGLGHYCISSWMDVRSCTPYIAQCNAERWEKEGGTLLQCLVWVGSEGGGSVGEWLAQQGQAGHCYQPLSPLFHQMQIQTQIQKQIFQLEKKKSDGLTKMRTKFNKHIGKIMWFFEYLYQLEW